MPRRAKKAVNTKGTHCQFGIAGNLGAVLALSVSTLQRTNGEGTTWMKSEHGNSLFLSPAQSIFSTTTSRKVHFLYNDFPKKSIFSTQTSQKKKKPFFIFFFKKSLPKTQGRPPPVRPAVPTRRPAPTLLQA